MAQTCKIQKEQQQQNKTKSFGPTTEFIQFVLIKDKERQRGRKKNKMESKDPSRCLCGFLFTEQNLQQAQLGFECLVLLVLLSQRNAVLFLRRPYSDTKTNTLTHTRLITADKTDTTTTGNEITPHKKMRCNPCVALLLS